jgi:hypothetical protein
LKFRVRALTSTSELDAPRRGDAGRAEVIYQAALVVPPWLGINPGSAKPADQILQSRRPSLRGVDFIGKLERADRKPNPEGAPHPL